MTLKSFRHIDASSLEDATISGGFMETAVMAGGTDLLGALKDNIYPRSPATILNIKTIPNLDYLIEDENGLRIGSLVKIREIATNKVVNEKYGLLAEAARTVASPQVRNMGTLGGNICQHPRCWYYRYPENFFNCLRKGGKRCNAIVGENQYHSIFGAARVGSTQCSSNCPGGIEIPLYLSKIREGKLIEAAEILLERNPIPAVTGRVCPRFCELACNRGEFDEAVSVREIERFMGDYIFAKSSEIIKSPPKGTGKRVAIIGSGPAGLSASYYLRKKGHDVTVYERMKEAGGMLRYCIPSNRLPRAVIHQQVEALRGMGIKFKLGTDLGSDESFDQLRNQYDSVFLATGAWSQKSLGIEKEELLTSGLDFLTNVSMGDRASPGTKVLVIGGGNVAVDVAITATRLGTKQVTMVCLESREEMPASPEDVEGAIEDGVVILPSWGPNRILKSAGKASGVEFVRCTSVFDNQGRFHPTFDTSVRRTIEADHVILATGQAPNFSYAPKTMRDSNGCMAADRKTQATNLPGVFAGGDLTTGTTSVIEAIAAGRRAANAINNFLKRDKPNDELHSKQFGELLQFNTKYLKTTHRIKNPKLPRSERDLEKEDYSSLDFTGAMEEANRCLNCGCVAVNAADIAPVLVALDAKIKTTRSTYDADQFFHAEPFSSTVLEPGELVTEIEIPTPRQNTSEAYLKFRTRKSIDFPTVSVAAAITIEKKNVTQARIVLGAVAPIPIRALEAEDYLKGKEVTEEVAETAGEIAVKGSNPLPKNKYKVQIVKILVKRAILCCSQRSSSY